MNLTINKKEYKSTDTDGVELLYESMEPIYRSELTQSVLDENIEENVLLLSNFVKFDKDKYIHISEFDDDKESQALIFKLANLENIKFREQGDKDTILLSNFIYLRDKYAGIRGLPDTTFSRLDTFRSSKEFDKSYGVYRIRQGGSRAGQLIYKQQRTDNFKKENRLYLRIHQSGPLSSENDQLVCHVRGTTLTGHRMTDFDTNMPVYVYDNQFHHCFYVDSRSINKSAEPSMYFGTSSFKDWPHSVHIEFLGCITLSGDGHDSIHNSNRKDGIDNWMKRLALKECVSLPFHWTSEKNYNLTLDYLDTECKHFNKYQAPTYSEFIDQNSISFYESKK